LDRHLSHNPPFQVLFPSRLPEEEDRASCLSIAAVDVERGLSKLDLTWTSPTPGRYRRYLEYSNRLFEAAPSNGWRGNFLTLLAGVVAAADGTSRRCAPDRAERDLLLFDWNPSGYELPPRSPAASPPRLPPLAPGCIRWRAAELRRARRPRQRPGPLT